MPVAGSSLTVARVMRKLQRALAAIGNKRTSDATVRSRAEALLAQGANILPGVHVSALATPALVRSLKAPRRRAAG